ncbi:MAG TPA: uracil-DNA glycosylase [Candidatus Micrarchaeia archaeon]|nr:uracil-DNA glycosylase [Candidatus Micrarchaeia archaeon]
MLEVAADCGERQGRLDAIAAEVRACTGCGLHRTRTQGVPGTGPVTARVMAVGEAPGENEDRQGLPFVGAAGSLLTDLLQGVGLSREDLFITNVLKSRPPQNRDPLPDEVAACAPYLDRQIALIRPLVILLLGRHALARLVPTAASISRCHGQAIRADGRVYLPVYHPAAALYNGGLLATLREDFLRLRALIDELEAGRLGEPGRRAEAPAGGAAQPGAGAGEPPPPASAQQLALF